MLRTAPLSGHYHVTKFFWQKCRADNGEGGYFKQKYFYRTCSDVENNLSGPELTILLAQLLTRP